MNNRQPPRRKTKKEKIAELEQVRKTQAGEIAWINTAACLTFLLGLILMVFEINIYRKTIIDWKIPASIGLLAGLVTMQLTKPYLEKIGSTFWFLRLVYNLVAIGGTLAFLIMWLNFNFADAQERRVLVPVVDTGYLAQGRYGCENPYAIVEFTKESKQLIFPCGLEIENQQLAAVTLRRGLWGFDIIVKQQLLR